MIVATRYAKSLLDLAVEKGQLEQVNKDMVLVDEVCKGSHDLVLMLKSPIINTDKKQIVLKEIFGGKISDMTLQFMNLMADKKREDILEEIGAAFTSQYKVYNNVTSAVVTSAVALDADTKAKIIALVKAEAKGEVEMTEKIDPSLIGGFILRVGDKQIDESVSRKLTDIKKTLLDKTYTHKL
jgi:F-type H+-transporting ATPase subunit delta